MLSVYPVNTTAAALRPGGKARQSDEVFVKNTHSGPRKQSRVLDCCAVASDFLISLVVRVTSIPAAVA